MTDDITVIRPYIKKDHNGIYSVAGTRIEYEDSDKNEDCSNEFDDINGSSDEEICEKIAKRKKVDVSIVTPDNYGDTSLEDFMKEVH